MAHAIHAYNGQCKNIHGHSYELHVTVTAKQAYDDYIPAPGFIIDFKELKKTVQEKVIRMLDHALLLSKDFTENNPACSFQENLVSFPAEPSAENMLLYIKQQLQRHLPEDVQLKRLRLYETGDSYAEWVDE